MYRQAVDRQSRDFTGFNRFAHDRDLAGPGYVAFKVPNSDTLYSNGWIDLTAVAGRDRHPADEAQILHPQHLRHVRQPKQSGHPHDRLQWRSLPARRPRLARGGAGGDHPVPGHHAPSLGIDARVRPVPGGSRRRAPLSGCGVDHSPLRPCSGRRAEIGRPPPSAGPGAAGLLRVLDYILRADGHLPGEEALVRRFRPIGVLGRASVRCAQPLIRRARGDRERLQGCDGARRDLRRPSSAHRPGRGWTRVNKGKYGYNYIRRAVINAAGLGANVPEENSSFTTFVDGDNVTARRVDRQLLAHPSPAAAGQRVLVGHALRCAARSNSTRTRFADTSSTIGRRGLEDGAGRIGRNPHPARSGQARELAACAGGALFRGDPLLSAQAGDARRPVAAAAGQAHRAGRAANAPRPKRAPMSGCRDRVRGATPRVLARGAGG